MKTCDTCKHWRNDEEDYGGGEITEPYDFDTGKKMVLPFEVKKCHSPNTLFCERPVAETQCCVQDGSQYMANLFTGPKFGCPNHEE